jgi:2Fe-2S ferredoxin
VSNVVNFCHGLYISSKKNRAKINYITHDNQIHNIEVQSGLTVMEGAVQNDIPGIDADCGGGMACATCHVYVNDEWFDKLPVKEDGEEDMLDMAFEPKKNSRLSCQIVVSDELDGLIVNIPSKQG